MVNFEKVEIIKKLGHGTYGTVYLVKYNGKDYALKVMKVLEEDKKENFVNDLWREIDTYKYIDTLKKSDQIFFTKLYGYQIYDNCNEQMNLPNKEALHYNKVKALYDSSVCGKLLIEYKGLVSLDDFNMYNLNEKEIASILLQVYKIALLLLEGGYSHTDIRFANLMITPTIKKTFQFIGKKIPYYGNQISIIDYGAVANKKYHFENLDGRKLFIDDPDFWLYFELGRFTQIAVTNGYENNCLPHKKYNKYLIISEYGKNIFLRLLTTKYRPFYIEHLKKYMKLFPKAEKTCNLIINNMNKITNNAELLEVIGKNIETIYFWLIHSKIYIQFKLKYPDVYRKIFRLCTTDYFLLPNDLIQKVIDTNKAEDLINLFIGIIYNE